MIRWKAVSQLLALTFLCLVAAHASPLCNTTVTTVIVNGPTDTFCVSAYGWSNSWYGAGYSGSYDASKNVLGDSAQYISYTTADTLVHSSWLLPNGVVTIASGADPTVPDYSASTSWTVSSPLTLLDSSTARSTITDANGLAIQITSHAEDGGIRQTFHITNNTSSALSNVYFVQYMNYFPDGASNPTLGTAIYEPVSDLDTTVHNGLWFDGVDDSPSLIHNGGTCGGFGALCTDPNSYMIGTPAAVLAQINGGGALPNGATTLAKNPNGAAGALMWNLSGSLSIGASQDATVELLPEPGTIWLGAGALAGLLIRRRLRK